MSKIAITSLQQAMGCSFMCTYIQQYTLSSMRKLYYIVLFPGYFSILFVVAKKGPVDLWSTFCSTDSQILGVINRCWQLQRPFDKVSITIVACSYIGHQIGKEMLCNRNLFSLKTLSCTFIKKLFRERSIQFISLHK